MNVGLNEQTLQERVDILYFFCNLLQLLYSIPWIVEQVKQIQDPFK